MPENGFNRRLSAILSADAVGYSRLIAADEQATLSAFNGHLKELIEPEIAANHGRIVKLIGDGVLAEYVSVVDAMQAAVAIQRGMRDRDADLDEDRRLAFRIGVTFGEIVVDDGDIFGNGVNVAARLQEAAESGGIMISDRVHEDVRGKIDVLFDDLGPQAFKNLPEKIRAFRVLFDNKHPVPVRTRYSFRYSVLGYCLAFGAVVCIVGVVLFWRQSQYPESSASKKTSIAVLPFENKSNDRKQDYFAEGIADDINTDLSKLSGLVVIARYSTEKIASGGALDTKKVGAALGVTYLLTGSVRRSGKRLRINAQLVNVQSGEHLWADRYDGNFSDVFSLQDRITTRIVDALALKLNAKEKTRLVDHGTKDPAAFDAFAKGWQLLQRDTLDSFIEARPHLQSAVNLDPAYGRAHAALAWLYFTSSFGERGWYSNLGFLLANDAVERGYSHLRLALREPNAYAHAIKAYMMLRSGRPAESLTEFERALRLNPNDADALIYFSDALYWLERPGEGLAHAARAMRLNPTPPPAYFAILGRLRFGAEDYESAADALKRAIMLNSLDWRSYYFLVASLGYLGRLDEAAAITRKHNEEILPILRQTEPDLPRLILTSWSYWSTMRPQLHEQLTKGLKKAGIK